MGPAPTILVVAPRISSTAQRLARRLTRRSRKSLAQKVHELGPSDRLEVQGALQLNAPLSGKASASLSVKRASDGYLVTGDVDGKVGVMLHGQFGARLAAEAFVGAAASATFHYDDADGAVKGVEALVPFGKGDVKDLAGKLTRVELEANLNLELEARIGPQFLAVAGKAKVDPSIAYALVFDDGATYLERVYTLKGTAEGKAVSPLRPGQALISPDLAKAQTAVTVQWISRIPLPENDTSKALVFVMDAAGLADRFRGARHSLEIKVETERRKPGDDHGVTRTLSADDVHGAQLAAAMKAALRGDLDGAARELDAQVQARRFVEHGADWEIDVGWAGQGIEIAWRNEVRDYE